MTSELWAAWVSAGAAWAQAIGAVAAIVYAGKLARDGARREIAAQSASLDRERLAREASEKREQEARTVSEILATEARREARQSIVIAITAKLEQAILDCTDAIEAQQHAAAHGQESMFSGRLHLLSLTDLLESVNRLQERCDYPPLAFLIAGLSRRVKTIQGRAEYVGLTKANIARFNDVSKELALLRDSFNGYR